MSEAGEVLPSRLASLDIARGLAALSVVLWHWQHFFQVQGSDFDRSTQPLYAWLHVFYETNAHYAVTFFFVLSGFVFFWLYAEAVDMRRCGWKEFAVYRFARLYPLHAATLLAVLVLQLVFMAQSGSYFVYQNNDAYHFALHTLFLSHWGFEKGHSFNAPVWSVSLEIGLYACFFVLAFLRGARWPLVAAMVGFLVLVQIAGIGGRWPRAIEAFFTGGLTYFAIRAYLSWRPQRCLLDIPIAGLGLSLWAGMAASPVFAALMLEREPVQLYSRLLFPATIVTLVVLEARLRPNLEGFRWIGDISYSTYLIHFPLQILFALVFSALGFTAAVFLSPWVLVLFFAVLIPLALASFAWFERPVQNVIRRKYAPFRNKVAADARGDVIGAPDAASRTDA
jgi:peptidoglycan/LPS O-acetylase OafA/YrhL